MSTQHTESYVKITFKHEGTPYQYTNWTSPIAGFISSPDIEVELGPQNGTLETETAEITIPTSDFTERLLGLGVVSDVQVIVTEVTNDPDGVLIDSSRVFGGHVKSVVENPDGKTSCRSMRCESLKARLDSAVGVQATGTCPWRVYTDVCGANKADFTFQGVVSSVDILNFKVVITGLPAAPDSEFFSRGSLELDGVSVGVRYWSQLAPAEFHVNRIPPEDWVGQTVDVVAGDDYELETCKARFDREESFAGIGLKLPKYHSVFETGSYD